MAIDRYQRKIVVEQARGSIPSQIPETVWQSLILLETGLQRLEEACSSIDEQVVKAILEWRYRYPDMFMEDVIADQIKNGMISRYPVGWAEHAQDKFYIGDLTIDETSPFSLWTDYPFTITVGEVAHYPLLGFRTVGAYVTFMFLLRDRRYDEAFNCLNGRARRAAENERQLFDSLFQTPVSESDFQLVLFLLYRGLWAAFGPQERGAELKRTRGDRLISTIQFPAGLFAVADKNFYGDLLMKFRRAL